MLKVNKIIDNCLTMITDNMKKRIPTDMFDCLQRKVIEFKDCGKCDDIKFNFNETVSYVIDPSNNSMIVALGVAFASILSKNGFKVPQNLCNTYGFKFLGACYIMTKTACYIETNGVTGTKSRIIRCADIKDINTQSKKRTFESELEGYVYPAYAIEINVSQENMKPTIGEYTRYKFCFPNSESTVTMDDGTMLQFTSICPLIIMDRISKLYIRWAENHLIKFTYLKRDGSIRVARMTVKKDILMKMFDNDEERCDRVLHGFEMEKKYVHRGYIKLPEIDLPADDTSGLRAVNLIKVLDFTLTPPSKIKLDTTVTKSCSGARFVLMNELINEDLDNAKRIELAQASLVIFDVGFEDLVKFAKAKLHLNQLPEIVSNRLQKIDLDGSISITELDKLSYKVLAKAHGEQEADKMFETRMIDLNNGLIDITKEYNKAENKYEFVKELSKSKCLVIDYLKSDGTFERTAFTLSKDVVDKVYGLSWRSSSQNTMLGSQIKVVEGYLGIVAANYSAMFNTIATEIGVNVSNCKTMSEVKLALERALNYKLSELKERYESSRTAVQKRKEYLNIGGYCLTVDPYIVSQNKARLWRSYKQDGIKSIFEYNI